MASATEDLVEEQNKDVNMEEVKKETISPAEKEEEGHEVPVARKEKKSRERRSMTRGSVVVAQYYSNRWTNLMHKYVHKPVEKSILKITHHASTNPKAYVVSIICFSLAMVAIGLSTNYHIETREDKLFTPFDALARQHFDWIEDESEFQTNPRSMVFFIHADADNVMGQEGPSRVFKVLNAIRDIDGYDELCSKSLLGRIDYETGETTCYVSSVTQFWNHSLDSFESEVKSDSDAINAMSEAKYPNGERVSVKHIIGNSVRNEENLLTSAQAFRTVVYLPADDDDVEKEAEEFEADVIDKILDMRDEWESEEGNQFHVELYTDRSFADEFSRGIANDLPLVPLVFIIMSIFCILVFSRKDRVRSRGMLGFGAVISVLLSLFTSYGLMFIIGVPLTSMTQILPFIMFGIGVDNVFVIVGEYERLGHIVDVVERVKVTMESTGVSITLTTLTSILAFASGCSSSIPLVYWLCLYAFPTVFFIYLYSITFIIALLVLDERRLQGNRRGCLVCFVDNREQEDDEPEESEESDQNNLRPTTELPLAERCMHWYSTKLMQKWVKVAVVIAFSILLGGLAYSASQLKVAFKVVDVLPSDSYLADFIETEDNYVELTAANPYAFFRFEDQSSEATQIAMQSYLDQLVKDVETIEDGPSNFWLQDFHEFVNNNTESMDDLTFTEQVDAFLEDPVYSLVYSTHIVRDEKTGNITSSRCQIEMPGIDFDYIQNQVDALEEVRSVSKQQEVNQGGGDWSFFTLDANYFIWEFYAVVVDELTISTILGVLMVTVISLILMPHIAGFLFVGPFVAILYIDLMGVLQIANIPIGPVTFVGLIMSIGLMVDYIVHIVLRYIESAAPDRESKVVDTLCSMGASVFVGGLSTLLGVVPLIFSSTEVFFTVFVIFCGLVALGMLHGLVLLPVMLSLLGPVSRECPTVPYQYNGRKEKEEQDDAPDLVAN